MEPVFAILFVAVLFACVPTSVFAVAGHADDRLLVEMTIVNNAAALGAFCLDGSLPAYHLHRGFGDGARNWLLQFEGGGWCNDVQSCKERAQNRHGSTRLMNKLAPFQGILSNNASRNPDFHNWNRVKLRYCDGGSFSGDAELNEGNMILHFKGQKIWQAIIEDLLPKGLATAEQALLSGCSAGGLSAILHCNNFASYLPKAKTVKCLSDAGFFMDAPDITMNHTQKIFYDNLITLQGIEHNLDKKCTSGVPDPKQCIFPQYLLKHITPPLFVLNTAYDMYQFHHILVPPNVDPMGRWKRCKINPAVDCNPHQMKSLQGFRDEMVAAVKPLMDSSNGGVFINSCFAHCQSELQETWLAPGSPKLQEKAIAEAVGDWYFDRKVSKYIDCPYPCNPTCHNLIEESPTAES